MTALRQQAWWAIGAIAVTLVVFGATDIAAGAKADPGISLDSATFDAALLF